MGYKNAFVSVSDKTGLYEFLKPLIGRGLRVVSTGGTAKYLKAKGLPVLDIREQTGFASVFSGRIKSLHPHIYMPLLARSWVKEDQKTLKKFKLSPFDLVVLNLYPFSENRNIKNERELTEWIDVGGPSVLRAAAKNFFSVTVVCSPADYQKVQKGTSLAQRKQLAAKVFSHLSQYDSGIAETLGAYSQMSFKGRLFKSLRYGENPHQKAAWYSRSRLGLHRALILQGKPLSFNNVLDLQAAVLGLRDFSQPVGVAVKHTNPCGIATHANAYQALKKALAADPLSVFGSVIGLNRKVTEAMARCLGKMFIECVIAPDFSPEALTVLKVKKNMRLLKWPDMLSFASGVESDFKPVDGGVLVQERAASLNSVSWDKNWKIIGSQPNEKTKQDLLFALRAAAHLKSNGIAIVKGGQTLGLGMGQVNRVDSVRLALSRRRQFHPQKNRALVLAGDGFFPFADSIERLSKEGVRWIIQPGGSLRDREVIEKAKQLKINMILTGLRHFKH